MPGTDVADMSLPESLKAVVFAGTQAAPEGEETALDISVVSWVPVADFNKDTAGSYNFYPVFSSEYTLAAGVVPPEITVAIAAPIMAFAAGGTVIDYLNLRASTENTVYKYVAPNMLLSKPGALTIKSGNADIIVKNSANTSLTNQTISVASGFEGSLTIQNLSIDQSAGGSPLSSGYAALESSSVEGFRLLLSGTNILKSGSGRAGVEVHDGTKITIGAADATGALQATGGLYGAGIGGNMGNILNLALPSGFGNISISGGNITAQGGSGAAGIGGGKGNTGGIVKIKNGAFVTISGAENNAHMNSIGSGDGFGTISGLNSAFEYQYRLDGSTQWQSIVSSSEKAGLAPGTYYLRIRGLDTKLPSAAVSFVIGTSSGGNPSASPSPLPTSGGSSTPIPTASSDTGGGGTGGTGTGGSTSGAGTVTSGTGGRTTRGTSSPRPTAAASAEATATAAASASPRPSPANSPTPSPSQRGSAISDGIGNAGMAGSANSGETSAAAQSGQAFLRQQHKPQNFYLHIYIGLS